MLRTLEVEMITLSPEMMLLLMRFAPAFSERVWDWAQVLVVGSLPDTFL